MTQQATSAKQSGSAEIRRQSLYELIGGADGVQQLVQAFYDLVETNPVAHKLHVLHLRGSGITHSRVEQFRFLSGFLGGPKLYIEQHGHSNVRNMHTHVVIDSEAKDLWLKCMGMALEDIGVASETKHLLMENFTAIAERLVNQNN